MALAMSPPVRMPPSAITWTYLPVSRRCSIRAPAASAMAVAWRTPPPGHELLPDRLAIQLLHPPGRLVVGEPRDLVEHRLRVLVPGPQALEVEDGQPSERADLGGRGWRDHTVHGRGHHRKRERPGVDLPGDVHVVGVTGPSRRNDGNLVEAVGPPTRLAHPDLDVHLP